MAIEYRCHSCATALKAPHYSAGQRGKCPACETVHLVPDAIRAGVKSIPAEIRDSRFGIEYEVSVLAADVERQFGNAPHFPRFSARNPKKPASPLRSLRIVGTVLLWLNMTLAIGLAAAIAMLIHAIVQALPVLAFGNPIHKELALIGLIVVLSIECLIVRAGYCMKTAQDHSMAVIGAFLASIPFFNPLSVPFGVTALILLSNPELEKKFG
jgi:hypothetical protein